MRERSAAAAGGAQTAAGSAPSTAPSAALRRRQPSYAMSGASARPFATEAVHLMCAVLLPLLGALQLTQDLAGPQLRCALAAQAGVPLAALALLAVRPALYRRVTTYIYITIHATVAGSVAAVNLGSTTGFLGLEALKTGGMRATQALLARTGSFGGMNAFLLFPLAPVATAAATAAWAAAVMATSWRSCTGAFMQHPVAARQLGVAYQLLRPLIAPLEPLLLAAGIGRGHPAWHCHCVLAAMQLYIVAIGTTLLVARSQLRRYATWRAEQRQLDRQRRRQQAEAWGFGFKEPSSSSSDESDCGSLHKHASSRQQQQQGHTRLSQGRLPPSHHPADWQWVWAAQAQRALRPTRARLAVAVPLLAAVAAWHREAFG
ncbi:hypothetical protein ABPG75_003564 [Micractinium tetrahymenae]